MKRGIFDSGLTQNAANFAPLSPLPFLQRAATVFPALPAVVHGYGKKAQRLTWSELYRRCRMLRTLASR
jgi:fatty-acyl-CoA synthase